MASDLAVTFLDANVLARPVTRTLLMVGASDANLVVTWSAYVEAEAHLVAGCRTAFAFRCKRRKSRHQRATTSHWGAGSRRL